MGRWPIKETVVGIRFLVGALACAAAVGVSGCQSYKASPFDSVEFARAWRDRSEASPATRSTRDAGSTPSTRSAATVRSINLADAEAYALVFNPTLRLARQRAGVASARSAHAGQWEDPSLGINVERVLSGGADPWVVAGSINLTLPLSGRLDAEKARTAAAHHAELVRVSGEEFAVRHRVRATYIEWATQSAKLPLLDELVERLDAVNRLTAKLAETGAITRMEARVFQVERATRQAERIAVKARLAELRLQLLSHLGFAPDAAVAFADSAVSGPTARQATFTADASYAVRVATAEYETAERALKREIQAQYPDLVIGPGFGTDQGDERALLGLSLPLPLWNRNQQAIATARAERELARTQFEAAIEQTAAAHAAAKLQYDAAVERRLLHESTIVPAADEQAADAQRLAELGEVNAVLLLDAFVRRYEARLALLDARLAEGTAAIRLSELSGELPTTQPAPAAKGDQ